MQDSFLQHVNPSILCLLLFIGCLLMVTAGKGVRNRFFHKDEHEARGGVNSLLGALFGLWGFVLAITFGNAATRFENFRSIMVEEANLIRNVILRTDALPDSMQTDFLEELKKYLEARIDYYEYADDAEKIKQMQQNTTDIGKRLWKSAVDISFLPGFGFPGNNMMTALTSMFDIAARRDALLKSGIPLPISFMLFFLALFISFVGGFTSPVLNPKEWVVVVGFILLACIIILITIDLARPVGGLIRADVGQDKIVNLRKLF